MTGADVGELARMYVAFTGMVDEGPYPHGPDYMRDYRFRVFVARADGSGLRRVSQDGDHVASSPAWDPDGQALTYSVVYNHDYGDARRFRVRLDESPSTPVAITGGAPETDLRGRSSYNQVSPSPDGCTFAVTSLSGESAFGFRLVTATGDPIATCAPQCTYVSDLTWSPDGRWIAFTAIPAASASDEEPESSLYVLERATSAVTHVCDAVVTERYLFGWAPDSLHLVTVRYREWKYAAFIVARDGTGLRHLIDLNVGDESGEIRPAKPAWSPDGHYVAVPTLAAGDAFEIVMFRQDGQQQCSLAWPTPVLARIDDLARRHSVDSSW